MKKFFIIFASMLFLTSCSFKANENSTSDTKQEEISMSQDISLEENKKIGQKNLSDSPRHQQWVEIDNNGKIIYAYVVYPENKQSSSAVVLIHENKGLNDWARSMADQIAAEGYIVIAPDLLSSFDKDFQRTSDFITPDEATQALYSLNQETISSDITAVTQYVKNIGTFNGNLVSAGFCWGGSQSFRLAAKDQDYKASLVFYGTAPEEAEFYRSVNVPVYGFYAENDDRVNATIVQTQVAMQANTNMFEYEIYDGVGHAFMRQADAEDADQITINARDKAFERMKSILGEYK